MALNYLIICINMNMIDLFEGMNAFEWDYRSDTTGMEERERYTPIEPRTELW